MQFFLPLATYPDASSGMIVSNAVTFAERYGATLHACVINAAIPHISGTWASLMLDTAKMIEQAETLCANRG